MNAVFLNYNKCKRVCKMAKYSKTDDRIHDKKTTRDSNIELLKIIAVFMIVISHSIPYASGLLLPESGIDIWKASDNVQNIVLVFFRNLGPIGNLIFIICSAWFLIDINKVKSNKIAYIISDVFFISIAWLSFFLASGYDLTNIDIIQSLLPTTLSANWFVPCYLLLYAVHPLLNVVINNITKEILLLINISFFILYCIIGFIFPKSFFFNSFVGFIGIYFLIAYMKRNLKLMTNNIKFNLILLSIGICGWIGIILLTNNIGLHFRKFSHLMAMSNSNVNPFFIFIAVALFNLANIHRFNNKIINYISSMSLFIYVIHENLLVQKYIRFELFAYIKSTYSYDYLIAWVLLYAVINFFGGLFISILYSSSLKKFVYLISDKIVAIIKKLYNYCSKMILRLN